MSMAMAYGMKKRSKKGYAFGGEAEEDDATENEGGAFGVGMEKMSGGFAEGGEVEHKALDLVGKIMDSHRSKGAAANDVGVAEADKLPAEYDDLVLRDDFDDASGPGNEVGDEALDDADSDVVSKIMSSRKKKDRMPRPA